jgi:hypothetical protein
MLFRNAFLLLAGFGILASEPIEITVRTDSVVHDRFGGVGFHASFPLHWTTQEHFDQVLGKRWRELRPSFARVTHSWTKGQFGTSDPEVLAKLVDRLNFMKDSTQTEIYLTTMGVRPVPAGQQRRAYAEAVANDLEHLIQHGVTNLKYFCVTNELSLSKWAEMKDDLPTFRDYHQEIYNALKRRNLDVKLLATDASPIRYWGTLEWAAENMDGITGVYGGHHYLETDDPADMHFYSWFLEKCKWGSALARSKGKDFILGEFGSRQYHDRKHGVRWDTCLHYGTPQEPMAALQVAEATLGAINGGVYSMAYWTFTDYPDAPNVERINQWGVFKWLTNGSVPRAPYYSYGLLTKFFRGPATVYQVDASDPNIRVAAAQNNSDGTWSIAVINRNPQPSAFTLKIAGKPVNATFRKYLYDPANVPQTEDGDLQEPSGKLPVSNGVLHDTAGANTMTVYTTGYDDTAPGRVQGLQVEQAQNAKRLTWQPNSEPDLCYYRIFHNGQRIGSTIATEFLDAGPTRSKPGAYKVVAVDYSGNPSEP